MRPRCNIISQVDFERLFLKFILSIFHDLWLYSHVPLDALLPFAYPDNFQVTWLRLRRSLRWGTWGRQPFSGATKEGDYAKSKYIEALLTVVNRISLANAFDNCKISVEQINTMVHTYQLLARPCGLSFPGVKLNSCDQYYRSIPATLSPPTPGLKSCSAQRLSLFKLCGHSSRAGWRDWSTACRDVTALICQVDFGNLILKRNSHLETSLNQSLQLQSISFRCDNFGCL